MTFKERWESTESKIGRRLKYYGGYVLIAASFISLHSGEIISLFTTAGVTVPNWLPKIFLGAGIICYSAAKLTTNGVKQDSQVLPGKPT